MLNDKANPASEIRAIALEVAKELLDEPLNIGQAEHYTDFATRFLAAIEPAPQAAFDQEIKDSDELLRLLNLPPDRYRTDGGCINLPKVRAAVREPWDYPTIDPVNPPVQSSVGATPLPDEVREIVEQQRDELLVALEATVEAIRLFRNEPQLERLVSLRATAGYVAMDAAMDRGTDAIDAARGVK